MSSSTKILTDSQTHKEDYNTHDAGVFLHVTHPLSPSLHQQTNTQFTVLQAGCRSCRPTNSVRALKGKYHIPWTCLPQPHLGSSNFVSDHQWSNYGGARGGPAHLKDMAAPAKHLFWEGSRGPVKGPLKLQDDHPLFIDALLQFASVLVLKLQ